MSKNKRRDYKMQEQPKKKEDEVKEAELQVMEDPLLPKKSLFRVEEAAQYFGVARSTIYLWIDHGILQAEKYKLNEAMPGGGMIRIPRASLLGCRFNARFDPML